VAANLATEQIGAGWRKKREPEGAARGDLDRALTANVRRFRSEQTDPRIRQERAGELMGFPSLVHHDEADGTGCVETDFLRVEAKVLHREPDILDAGITGVQQRDRPQEQEENRSVCGCHNGVRVRRHKGLVNGGTEDGSPAYAGSHGCPSSAVVCYGGRIKPWRNAGGCPPKPWRRRTRFGGFRRRSQRDHGCKAVGLHSAIEGRLKLVEVWGGPIGTLERYSDCSKAESSVI
jgi:hypothetical protein